MKKILNRNSMAKMPIVSIRLDREILDTLRAVCFEAGEIEHSVAIQRMLKFLLRPDNLKSTKGIIQT